MSRFQVSHTKPYLPLSRHLDPEPSFQSKLLSQTVLTPWTLVRDARPKDRPSPFSHLGLTLVTLPEVPISSVTKIRLLSVFVAVSHDSLPLSLGE